jgi:hypothetical protein
MGLQTPNEFNMHPGNCHVCHQAIREDQYAIEHMGDGELFASKDPRFSTINDRLSGGVNLWFHPECATVMVLRLAHDVMRVKSMKDQPARVVEVLQGVAKVNQAR